ncbi:ROK family transcriptional regulator [Cellulomonas soli]|uniref:Transcriptional regulator n=1 Tax=Cellulomonas soli TaxID=931535 RepID=A0A512PEZ0_9CELL|nr:ROK family transcriptional regulator [Cellulomonas soli]NYI59450.1 putative NBD/HSP70 family sugar kinase [Cellulomonas soli]GEP69758.1 transcriptional regulator [Cellulomonas soli]
MPSRDDAQVARQDRMREHNLSLTLRRVVDSRTPLSRAEVAASTGLARATVSGIVDQLIAAGLVRELDPVFRQRAGRPAVPLAPARGTVAGVGMEVNVDYLGVRALDLAGTILAERLEQVDLRASDPADVLTRLARLAADVLAVLDETGVRVAGTALALPGLVDRVTGPLRVAPNLRWRDLDVVAELCREPALAAHPPRLANEANLAARAEAHARRDTGDGPPSFVYVSGEVGIGGALVLDGEIFLGRHGWSGEIGHMVLDSCSERGTLEELAGQDAILRAAGVPVGLPIETLTAVLDHGDPQEREVARTAVRGAGRSLGIALANVVNVVDIGEIVLGGTFSLLFDDLQHEVAAELARRVIFAPWSPLQVSRAVADPYPAMTGGALAVLRTVVAEPAAWLRATD